MEITATDHGAMLRLRFPKADASAGWDQTRRLIVWLHNATESTLALADGPDGSVLIASTQVGNGAAPVGKDGRKLFRMWLAIKVPKPAASSLLYRNETRDRVFARLDYADDVEELLVRVGTSLISAEQAEYNLQSEVGARAFDELTEESRVSWRDVLSRVEVVDARQVEHAAAHGSADRLRVLYSALYRSALFPRRAFETDRLSGRPVHYSPYDEQGRVFDGVLSTDSGFWDGCARSASLEYLCLKYFKCLNKLEYSVLKTNMLHGYHAASPLPRDAGTARSTRC
jgi:putative alpha-1,2-mannosidase